jgi:glycosyltransferase involved in cell wall biosynthesis
MFKNKTNIIFFSPSIEDGGVEKNLEYLTNYFLKKKKEISIISANSDKKKNFSNKINFIAPDTNLFINSSRICKSLVCFFLILTVIKKKMIIVSFNNNIFAIFIAKLIGAKIIIRSNTSLHSYSKNFFKKKIFSFFFRFADVVIVNSKAMVREMKILLDVNSTHIYNPIENINTILKKSEENLKLKYFKRNTLKILIIGRLVKQKNQMLILKSLNQIKNKINFKCIIIGEGEEKYNLNKFIDQQNLKGLIKIIKYQKNIYPYLKKSDLFILSSNYEGLPNVLIEALVFKKIIFSTNCPTGPREILNNGKYGVLYPKNNYKILSKLILNFNKNKILYTKKALKGFDSLSRFNLDVNCKKYLDIVEEINER